MSSFEASTFTCITDVTVMIIIWISVFQRKTAHPFTWSLHVKQRLLLGAKLRLRCLYNGILCYVQWMNER
jgi:hypothetical protein